MPEWRTAENLHLDLNPWTYFSDTLPLEDLTYDQLRDFSKEINSVTHRSGPNVQGLIALNHNRVNDGGTVVLSGFHKCFKLWRDSLGSMYENIHKDSKESGHLVWRGNGAGSYKFAQSDPIHQFKQRITMRAGSLLIWDQRIVHGAAHNDSSNFRLAQFIKAFRRSPISDTRLSLRSKRIEAELSLNSSTEQITSAARRLLGISTFSD
jgi:ectoine hydroxylase-related dioxygenase (phytanoyl-CoA dioxygenase family)